MGAFSCGVRGSPTPAKAVVSEYFNRIQNGRFEAALDLYSPYFYESTTRDQWLTSLKKVNDELGSPQTYEATRWAISQVAGTQKSGTYTVLTYSVRYAKYPAEETFTVYQPSIGGEPRITRHSIHSDGLVLQ
jgi:hypothetical protein